MVVTRSTTLLALLAVTCSAESPISDELQQPVTPNVNTTTGRLVTFWLPDESVSRAVGFFLGDSPDEDEVIKKVATENAGDMTETWKSLANGGADLLGQLLAGKTPDPWKLAQTFIPVLAGMANPMLGAACAVILSFCGAAFGGASPDIYSKIMAQLPAIIQDSIFKQQMKDIGGDLMDIVDSSNFWSGIINSTHDKNLRRAAMMKFESDLDEKKRKVFGGCYDEPSSADCIAWQKGGEVIHSVFFAGLHLQTVTENANCYAGDVPTVRRTAAHLRERGEKYMTLLRASFDAFRAHRLSQIVGGIVKAKPPHPGLCCVHNCEVCCESQCSYVSGGTDSLSNTDILGQCGYSQYRNSEYVGSRNALTSAVELCVAKYSGVITAHLDVLKSQIDAIEVMVNAAPQLSAADEQLIV